MNTDCLNREEMKGIFCESQYLKNGTPYEDGHIDRNVNKNLWNPIKVRNVSYKKMRVLDPHTLFM